jgi:hypothetical protein
VFELGVASEYLDDAMLGPLCLLYTRRIGILPWIRGCDIDVKHGVDIVRVNGIVFDKKQQKYVRVGYKTEDSLRFFVLHNKFRQCGFVDWAKQQGDQFLFRLLQSCSDPSDAASKRINALLKRAGARGMNIEVLMEEEIDTDATRLQMGHALHLHCVSCNRPGQIKGSSGHISDLRSKLQSDWSQTSSLSPMMPASLESGTSSRTRLLRDDRTARAVRRAR